MHAARYRLFVTVAIWVCLIGGVTILLQTYLMGLALGSLCSEHKWVCRFMTDPSTQTLNTTDEIIKIITGVIQSIGALIGLFGRIKLNDEFSNTGALNNNKWYWISAGEEDGHIFLSQGILSINDIDDYRKRQQTPELVLQGVVTKLNGTVLPEPYCSFAATDITLGRKTTGRMIYSWKYDDTAGSRSGVTILSINYKEARSFKWLWIRKRVFVENMRGNVFSDQSYGKGHIEIYRSIEEAESRSEAIALTVAPSNQLSRPSRRRRTSRPEVASALR
jgi:hypothetical protein